MLFKSRFLEIPVIPTPQLEKSPYSSRVTQLKTLPPQEDLCQTHFEVFASILFCMCIYETWIAGYVHVFAWHDAQFLWLFPVSSLGWLADCFPLKKLKSDVENMFSKKLFLNVFFSRELLEHLGLELISWSR